MAKAPAPKAPASKKEKNPPPVEDDDDEDLQKDEETEGDKKAGGKLNLKLIIMIAGAVIVTAGLTAGLMMFLGGGGSPAPVAEVSDGHGAPADEHGAPPVAPQRASGGHGAPPAESGSGGHGGGDGEAGLAGTGAPVNIKFDSFIVNLNDLGGRRMLKLTMSIDADNQDLADEINAKMPQFRDTILLLLSSIQSDDISGIDGKQRLKNQMLNRINPNLTRGKIRNLYFSEIVVQ
jgi:flagellar FliL protein